MTITINTSSKTIALEDSVAFTELMKFVEDCNLQDYTISIKQNIKFNNVNNYPPGVRSPYIPPYKPYCESIKYKHTEPSTIEPIVEFTTGKWTPFGPTED
jgi:hypothetical protein